MFSGPMLGVTRSLLIPMLIYTRKIVASGVVSDIAFRRSFALPAVCAVMQNASGFSERRSLPNIKFDHPDTHPLSYLYLYKIFVKSTPNPGLDQKNSVSDVDCQRCLRLAVWLQTQLADYTKVKVYAI